MQQWQKSACQLTLLLSVVSNPFDLSSPHCKPSAGTRRRSAMQPIHAQQRAALRSRPASTPAAGGCRRAGNVDVC